MLVKDEAVLYLEQADRTEHLNSAATAIWQCLDGRTILRELADDIAAVTPWGRAAVEADLVALVRGFQRQGLLEPPPAPPRPRESGGATQTTEPGWHTPRLVRVPSGACTQRTDLPWSATRAVRVGRYLLGVRSATPQLDRLVTHVLGTHLVEDATAPPNYSLRLASPDGLGYHRLFRTCETSVRTRSLHRLLRALCGFLAEYDAEQDTTVVHLDALVLVRDGQAHLLPPQLRPLLPAEDVLRRQGFGVVDAATAALDPERGDLRVQAPLFEVDDATLTEARRLEPEPVESSPAVDPGRYPVRSWVHVSIEKGSSSSPAAVVAAANRRVRNRSAVGAQTALSTLACVASTTQLVEVAPAQPTTVTLNQLAKP